METSWIALLVAFAGGSVVATVVSAFVTHLVFHPVISVRLDERKGSHGAVTLRHYDQGKFTHESQAKYFRLHIENTGLSTVKACSGYITKLTRREGGQVTNSEEEVVYLGWASYGHGDARDIPRGAFFYMDIATLHLHAAGNKLEVKHLTSSLENFFKPGGTYTLEVLVASDNARPRRIKVEFTFDPSSDRLQFIPIKRARYPWWDWWLRSWWRGPTA
jgi:hypothetical protein